MRQERKDKLIKVKEAVIVEGKYDKIKLSSVIDGLIIETNGFRIFKDKEKQNLIRRLADTRGILVLTDSDSAGFVIRNFLKGVVPNNKIKHAYIPDVYGKERRKEKPSKEGKLGVEGIDQNIILEAIRRAGIKCGVSDKVGERREITKIDLFETGLSGNDDSAEKRKILLKHLSLPEHMTTNALLQVLNCIMDYEEYMNTIKELGI